MLNRNKTTFVLSVLASAALLLTACSGNASTSSGPATVVFWQHTDPARDAVVRTLAGQLEKKEPGLKVQEQFIPYAQYFDKLVTALKSGTGPDVFQVPEEMSEQFIKAGLISPVPANVATTASIDKSLLPAATTRWKSDGKYYGLPTDVETGVLYANTQLLTKCGGDPTNLPKTWASLLKEAQKCTIRDTDGNITQAGLDTSDSWTLTTQAMYEDPNAHIFSPQNCSVDLTSPSVENAWSTTAKFVQGPDAVDSSKFLPGKSAFQLGKAVFAIGLPVNMSTLQQQYPNVHFVMGQAPTTDGTPSTFVRGWAYVVSAKAKDQTAAWKLANQLGDAAAQKYWFQHAGSLPALATEPTNLATTPDLKVALGTLRYAHPIQNIAIATTDSLNSAWTSIALGKPIPATLTTAQAAIDGDIQDALSCSK